MAGQKLHRLLLVDDNQDLVSALKKGLEKQDFQVDGFSNPEVALQKFKADYYDSILLDIRMPRMSGFELYWALKGIDDKPTFAFLSAHHDYAKQARAILPSMNTDCFIEKPIAVERLIKKLESCAKNNVS